MRRKIFSWFFLLYLCFSLGIRLYHYKESLYFIYDIGRDAMVLKSMTEGDLKLVGPTTGLPGLFLGPLWYYVGLPGFILSQGNPWGFQLGYILITSLSIPLFWWLTHYLFKSRVWAVMAAFLLAMIPGSITGHTFVWNPMLSIPLMAGAYLLLAAGRYKPLSIAGGFFLLALTLQAEFAYAIFYVTVLFLLIPWLVKVKRKQTYALVLMAIALTLLPQLLFEVKNHFAMSKALMDNLNKTGTTVSLGYLWKHRPAQLWLYTKNQLFKLPQCNDQAMMAFTFVLLIGLVSLAWKGEYREKLLGLFLFIPYALYMFWKGNYGYFFDYYLTSHFIFTLLVGLYGLKTLVEWKSAWWWRLPSTAAAMVLLGFLGWSSFDHWYHVIYKPINNAGLLKMSQAVTRLYEWREQDHTYPGSFRIYTPNRLTENYDYLIHWQSKQMQIQTPLTVLTSGEPVRYLLFEPEEHFYNERFLPWYTESTLGYRKTRQEKIGILTLESWKL